MKIWKIVQAQTNGLYSGWILPNGEMVDIRAGGGVNDIIHGQYVRNHLKLFGIQEKNKIKGLSELINMAFLKGAIRIARLGSVMFIEGDASHVRKSVEKIHQFAKTHNVNQITYQNFPISGVSRKMDVEGLYSI